LLVYRRRTIPAKAPRVIARCRKAGRNGNDAGRLVGDEAARK